MSVQFLHKLEQDRTVKFVVLNLCVHTNTDTTVGIYSRD